MVKGQENRTEAAELLIDTGTGYRLQATQPPPSGSEFPIYIHGRNIKVKLHRDYAAV
jgi:hypothetical protein